ncbi:MAG: hypothetical protein E6Q97_27690 [Desulfurellales bacterium]|nr:MAG: hypothetical protein E6Q97_27690 [Desulfurellales bacterium]
MSGKNLVVITPEKQAAAKAKADEERARIYDNGYAEGRIHGRREMLHTRPFLAAAALFAAVLVGGVIGAVAAMRVYEQGAYTMGAVIGRIGQTPDTPAPKLIITDPDAPVARDDCGYARDANGRWKRQGDCNAQ